MCVLRAVARPRPRHPLVTRGRQSRTHASVDEGVLSEGSRATSRSTWSTALYGVRDDEHRAAGTSDRSPILRSCASCPSEADPDEGRVASKRATASCLSFNPSTRQAQLAGGGGLSPSRPRRPGSLARRSLRPVGSVFAADASGRFAASLAAHSRQGVFGDAERRCRPSIATIVVFQWPTCRPGHVEVRPVNHRVSSSSADPRERAYCVTTACGRRPVEEVDRRSQLPARTHRCPRATPSETTKNAGKRISCSGAVPRAALPPQLRRSSPPDQG